MKRSKRIGLSVTPAEYVMLVKKSGGRSVSGFCYDIVMEQAEEMPDKVATSYANLPPDFLRELSAIGNNLNQMTRLSHSERNGRLLDHATLQLRVDTAVKALEALREKYAG